MDFQPFAHVIGDLVCLRNDDRSHGRLMIEWAGGGFNADIVSEWLYNGSLEDCKKLLISI